MNSFITFLNSLKNKENHNLLEAIHQGYSTIFESKRIVSEKSLRLLKQKEQTISDELDEISKQIESLYSQGKNDEADQLAMKATNLAQELEDVGDELEQIGDKSISRREIEGQEKLYNELQIEPDETRKEEIRKELNKSQFDEAFFDEQIKFGARNQAIEDAHEAGLQGQAAIDFVNERFNEDGTRKKNPSTILTPPQKKLPR